MVVDSMEEIIVSEKRKRPIKLEAQKIEFDKNSDNDSPKALSMKLLKTNSTAAALKIVDNKDVPLSSELDSTDIHINLELNDSNIQVNSELDDEYNDNANISDTLALANQSNQATSELDLSTKILPDSKTSLKLEDSQLPVSEKSRSKSPIKENNNLSPLQSTNDDVDLKNNKNSHNNANSNKDSINQKDKNLVDDSNINSVNESDNADQDGQLILEATQQSNKFDRNKNLNNLTVDSNRIENLLSLVDFYCDKENEFMTRFRNDYRVLFRMLHRIKSPDERKRIEQRIDHIFATTGTFVNNLSHLLKIKTTLRTIKLSLDSN